MPFLRNVPGLEAVFRDYAKKGVQFFIIYKSLVHPGTNGFVEAYTQGERRKQLATARRRLGTTVPMVSDSLDGSITRALQSAPNAEFIVDASGKLLSRKFWHDPAALRTFLAERLGAVEPPTQVEDLDMQLEFPQRKAPRGIVPPQKMPKGMSILKSQPVLRTRPILPEGQGDTPFFAKLLAEGSGPLCEEGAGNLYLGFYLDPVYDVHWNNPAGRLSWRIERAERAGQKAAAATDFTPLTGTSPKYEHEIDIDPREFLIEAKLPIQTELTLTVTYTVCADDDSFCMPVTQQHRLWLERAPGMASRAGDWMTKLVGDPLQWDANDDGRVTRAELPVERAQIILLHFDRNHDNEISKTEAALFHDMIRIAPGEKDR
ncbi:MAG: hypothetical protein AB8H80_08075 [Planctomycetota bacterium]